MSPSSLWRRARAVIRKRRAEREFDEEAQTHIALQVEENLAKGMPEDEARRVALRDFGGLERVREEHREARGMPRVEMIWKDLVYAARGFGRSPFFALAAVLTLALGVGANTAVFSLLDQIFFRLPPVPEAERLVSLYHVDHKRGGFNSTSYPDYEFYRDQTEVFEELAAFLRIPTNLRSGEFAEAIRVELVSPNYFRMVRIEPERGRFFLPEEGVRDSEHPVAVLSFDFWQEHFGGRPDVVGAELQLHETRFTVVGVAPRDFGGTLLDWYGAPAMWIPITMRLEVLPVWATFDWVKERGAYSFQATGRLRDGISVPQAQAGMDSARAALIREYPGFAERFDVRVVPLGEARFSPSWRGRLTTHFGLMSAAVLLVLLLACANVSGLLIIRGFRRRKEVGVRLALGAGRGRLAAQLHTESLLLSLLGGAAGVVVAHWTLRLLSSMYNPFGIPLAVRYGLDGRALAFAILVALAAGLLFGALPLRQTLGVNLLESLKPGASGRRLGLPEYLVVIQVAITVVLLAGAGLFLKTLRNGAGVLSASSPETILVADLELRANGILDTDARRVGERVLGAVRQLPGAGAAVLASDVPLGGRRHASSVWKIDPEKKVQIDYNVVTPGYTELMGIPLLRGRNLGERDHRDAPPAAVVSARMAAEFWPGEDPLGQRFRMKTFQKGEKEIEVVGVVRDDSRIRNLRDSPRGRIYLSLAQHGARDFKLLLRCLAPPSALAGMLRQVFQEVDPRLPLGEVRTLEVQLERAMSRERSAFFLLTTLGLIALMLAVVGVYAAVASTVSLRTREIGIRMALGAQRSGVLWREIRRGATLALAGGVAGAGVAFVCGRWVESLLFGVSPADPGALLAAPAILLLASVAAAYIPALRAAGTDPARVLREE